MLSVGRQTEDKVVVVVVGGGGGGRGGTKGRQQNASPRIPN